MTVYPFDPPTRTLLGPGPSAVHPRVLQAMARPTIGHLDPKFIVMMDEIRVMLRRAFLTENDITLVASGPGSVGMEMCFVNLVEPGDTIVVCENGVFGGRMSENVERCGGVVIRVEETWGRAVDVETVKHVLAEHPEAKALAFVHAETSTGVLSGAASLCEVAREHECLIIMDAVTSLGGVPVRVDDWGVDAVFSGSQKCLSCAPGLSPVSFSERAMQAVRGRKHRVQSWFLDLNLLTAYWSGDARRTYHHTAPVNALYGLHEALRMLHEEGLEAAWARHEAHHKRLRDGLASLGLGFFVEEPHRIPQLNAIALPAGLDEHAARRRMLEEFDLEVGPGLGPLAGRIWRVGLMGQSSTARNVAYCIDVLGEVIGRRSG